MSAHLAVLELAALLRSGARANEAIKNFRIEELSEFEQKQYHYIWDVAHLSGGQLAQALDRLAEVFEKQQLQLAEIRLAFSSPKATANLILLLPPIAMLASELIGISSLWVALSTSLGSISLGLGLLLLILARIISLRMLNRAKPKQQDPGGFLDAVVVGLSAGLSIKAATKLAQSKQQEHFAELPSTDQLDALQTSIANSEQSGISLAGILLAKADTLRVRSWQESKATVSKLAVSLMIPLGTTALPAFVLLAVVPIGLGMFSRLQ